MKYFICSLISENHSIGNCLLGIPSEHTERIILASRTQTIIYETENEDFYISIPVLLKLKDQSAHHGLILKSKTTLLLPRIDVELEIPEEEIKTLPKALEEIFCYFRGVYFSSNMILILEPEKLLEYVE